MDHTEENNALSSSGFSPERQIPTHDKVDLIEHEEIPSATSDDLSQLGSPDSGTREMAPLQRGQLTITEIGDKTTQQSHHIGLRIVIMSSVVFAVAVTIALIINIYLGPKEVGIHGAVAADSFECSDMGMSIMHQGGSAVDAAITAGLCEGVVAAHATGIGGGGFMLIQDHRNHKTTILDFRETAPAQVTESLVDNLNLQDKPGLQVGVPGLLRGFAEAHKLFGKLPWSDVVKPVIKLSKEGFNISKIIVDLLKSHVDIASLSPSLQLLYANNGHWKEGETITRPRLAVALQLIADKGAEVFYTGELAQSIVNMIKHNGGVMSMSDLKNYKVVHRDPIKSSYNGYKIVTMPAPGSGPVLVKMLNIMENFNWTQDDQNAPLTYHRMIEAFKFAYASQTSLADPDFESGVKASSYSMIDKENGKKIFKLILEGNGTQSYDFYMSSGSGVNSHGTSHVSVVDSDEFYVSMTVSLNHLFGSKLMTNTGIILNDHIMDFSLPNVNKDHPSVDLAISSLNKIVPGKRPQSSMTPTVVYTSDAPCGPRFAIGASNGSRIISGIAETLMNLMSFKMNLSAAIEAPRVHNQMLKESFNVTEVEDGISDEIISSLKEMGHKILQTTEPINAVQGVLKVNDSISAHSDSRKGGKAAVY